MLKYIFLAGFLALTGCVNPYVINYKSTLSQGADGETARLELNKEPAKLVTSTNMQADTLAMMENGYLMIGKSSFRSKAINENMALKEAAKVGASVVMVGKKYVKSVTQSVPVAEWVPPTQVTYTETVNHPFKPKNNYERRFTKTIEGEYQTTYVPQKVGYFAYSATYWAKSKPPIFGVMVQALDASERKIIKSNKGVLVKAIIKDSPAFNADILIDDIIVEINDKAVSDPGNFFKTVIANAGKTVSVLILRDGNQLTKTLTILSQNN